MPLFIPLYSQLSRLDWIYVHAKIDPILKNRFTEGRAFLPILSYFFDMKVPSVSILVIALAGMIFGADGWKQADEGSFRFEIPADWEKKKVQGIDSHVGRYEGPSGHLEFDQEFGYYTAFGSRRAIADMKAKEANPNLIPPGEEIWHVDGQLASFSFSSNQAAIFIPNEKGQWTLSIRIAFSNEDFLPTARRILESVKVNAEP